MRTDVEVFRGVPNQLFSFLQVGFLFPIFLGFLDLETSLRKKKEKDIRVKKLLCLQCLQ